MLSGMEKLMDGVYEPVSLSNEVKSKTKKDLIIQLNCSQKECVKVLKELGKLKQAISQTSLLEFVDCLNKIQNIDDEEILNYHFKKYNASQSAVIAGLFGLNQEVEKECYYLHDFLYPNLYKKANDDYKNEDIDVEKMTKWVNECIQLYKQLQEKADDLYFDIDNNNDYAVYLMHKVKRNCYLYGYDWMRYSQDCKDIVIDCFKSFVEISDLLNKDLIREDGWIIKE